MPSAFTHAVVGAAISTLAPRRFRGAKLAIVLAVAAAAPDADVLAFGFGIPYAHLLGHRGLTHSLPFAFLVAGVLWSWLAHGSLRSRAGGELFLIIFLACASHGVLDAFTDAGLVSRTTMGQRSEGSSSRRSRGARARPSEMILRPNRPYRVLVATAASGLRGVVPSFTSTYARWFFSYATDFTDYTDFTEQKFGPTKPYIRAIRG